MVDVPKKSLASYIGFVWAAFIFNGLVGLDGYGVLMIPDAGYCTYLRV